MKKLFAMAVALLTATSMFAQPEAGTFTLQPSAGIAIASLSGDGTKAKVGFQGRFEGAYQVTDAFAVSLGLGCSQYGAKAENSDTKYYDFSSPLRYRLPELPKSCAGSGGGECGLCREYKSQSLCDSGF